MFYGMGCAALDGGVPMTAKSSFKESARVKFAFGVLRLLWEELKTLNRVKIKSLYKIAVGYIRMKYFKPKKIPKKKQLTLGERMALRQEASYRLSS
jgi:hypothetical protein